VELDALESRLVTIERLKKKYGGSIAAIEVTRAEFAVLVERDAGRDARIAVLEQMCEERERALGERAALLGAQRRRAASDLEKLVAAELAALAMPAARFSVAWEPLERIGANGAERAELRLAPNPGEPERALAKSASGGELSRVLLALIVALADRREPVALVFDEIDAGIGGATALAVGTRLAELGRAAQVVVVTHLAQIAAQGQAHYVLRKHESHATTRIDLEPLDAHDERHAEIARMLAGHVSAVALEHAAALLAGSHV
jgi:DNA repair protein RecN (Recombination protein N)